MTTSGVCSHCRTGVDENTPGMDTIVDYGTTVEPKLLHPTCNDVQHGISRRDSMRWTAATRNQGQNKDKNRERGGRK